jgi:hypothetical protein
MRPFRRGWGTMAGSGNLVALRGANTKTPVACFISLLIVTETQYHYNGGVKELAKIGADYGSQLCNLFAGRSLG